MPRRVMTRAESRAIARSLVAWYRRVRRDLPWRRTRDPYRIWVAEVMLQQTTVPVVIPYYRRFLGRFPNPRTLARASLTEVLAQWSGLGYYRRARHLHAAARHVVKHRAGRLPRTLGGMLALPGVGRYTAGAVLSIAFGEKTPILDGNVARVLSRLRLRRGDPRAAPNQKALWAMAGQLVESTPAPGDLNQALMELGATLCTSRAPACARCPVRRRCAARSAGLQETVPRPRRARVPVRVRTAVALVEKSGRLLMRRRDESALMNGLWEFPAIPTRGEGRAARHDRLRAVPLECIGTLRHTITHRRLQVTIVRVRLLAEPRGTNYRWVTRGQARKLPTSSLVPKVLARTEH